MIGAKALCGYILEEVVARMLKDNGYRLLSDHLDDTAALVQKKGALYVKGRGSDHQADALGDLTTPIPFGLPVRLFVEAKHYAQPVDLPVLRNAHGVIHDVNQCYATRRTGGRPTQRYDYRYAVFSTSGFTREADDFAQAHQISLHDLSADSAEPLREQVKATAGALLDSAKFAGLRRFPLHAVRLALRAVLETLVLPQETALFSPAPDDLEARLQHASQRLPDLASLLRILPPGSLAATLSDITTKASSWQYLVGYPDGRSVLALRPDDLHAFTKHCKDPERELIKVDIHYQPSRRTGHGEYVISPLDPAPGNFRLRFGAPDIVARDVLTTPAPEPDSGPEAEHPVSITVFHERRTVRLSYVPKQVPREVPGDATAVATWLRRELSPPVPSAGRHDERDVMKDIEDGDSGHPTEADDASQQGANETGTDEIPWVRWTPSEARRLLQRVSPTRATLLLDLAEGPKHGLGRNDVLASVGREADRKLNGVINPVVSALNALRREEQLRPDLRCPVLSRRVRGKVIGYRLSPEVRDALRPIAKGRPERP